MTLQTDAIYVENIKSELSYLLAPGSKSSREREGQGANGPWSELAIDWNGHGPIGRFAPERNGPGTKRGDYWSGHRKYSQLAIDPATGTIAIRLFIRLI